ncbi:MAG: PAS domain S-box protein [Bacteroidota bacterium]
MENKTEWLAAYADLVDTIFIKADADGTIQKVSGTYEDWKFDPAVWLGHSLTTLLDAGTYKSLHYQLTTQPTQKAKTGHSAVLWEQKSYPVQCVASLRDQGWVLSLTPTCASVHSFEKTDEMFRSVVGNIQDAVCITNGNSENPEIIYVNASFCELTEYSAEELLGKNPNMLQGPDTDTNVTQGLRETIAQGEPWQGRTYNYTKTGKRYFVEWKIFPIYNDKGEVANFVSLQNNLSADVAQRRHASIREERLLQAQEIGKIGGWIVDLVNNQVWWSDQVKRLHEVPLDYEPDLEEAINFYHPDYQEVIRNAVADASLNQSTWDLECLFITAKGREIWVRAMGHPIVKDGQVVQLTGVFQDIDEKKRAQIEMENYSRLIELSINLIGIANFQGFFEQLNPQWEKTLGHSIETLTSQPSTNFIHPDDLERTIQFTTEIAQESHQLGNIMNRFRCADGSYRWLEWSFVTDLQREKVYFVARDVTEELQYKEKLEEYNRLFNISNDLISISNFDGLFTQLNPEWTRALGYTEEELQTKPFLEFVHPNDVEYTLKEAEALWSDKHEVVNFKNRYLKKTGGYEWLEWNAISDQENQKIYSVTRIVTDSILQQQRLEEYRQLFHLSPEYMIVINLDGQVLEMNQKMREALHLTLDDNLSTFEWEEIAHQIGMTPLQEVLDKNEQRISETIPPTNTTYTTSQGKEVTLQWTAVVNTPSNRLFAVGRDVTQQLAQEAELQRKKVMERALLASPGAMVCIINQEGVITATNQNWIKFGQQKHGPLTNSAVGANYLKDIETGVADGEEQLRTALQGIRGVLSAGQHYEEEYPYHHQKSQYWFRMRAEPIPLEGGGAVISHLDVTEKKNTERILKKAQYRFNLLSTNLREVFWIRDRHEMHFISDSFEDLWKVPKSTIFDNPDIFFGSIYDKDKPRIAEALQVHFAGAPFNEEYRIVSPDGELLWILARADAIKDDQGNDLFVGTATDITHQKSVEEDLKVALEEKDMLIREIHHRVKNNLQLISSILYLNQLEAKDEGLQNFIRDTENRIKSLAKIHERLLQVHGFGHLNIQPYLQGLIRDISSSYSHEGVQITTEMDIADIRLHVDTVSTLGLLINELVSNAFKHAFQGRNSGSIWVSMKGDGELYHLSVQDNGIGLPEGHFPKHGSLGFQFIEVFVAQLQAESVDVDSKGGTTFRVFFPKSL